MCGQAMRREFVLVLKDIGSWDISRISDPGKAVPDSIKLSPSNAVGAAGQLEGRVQARVEPHGDGTG